MSISQAAQQGHPAGTEEDVKVALSPEEWERLDRLLRRAVAAAKIAAASADVAAPLLLSSDLRVCCLALQSASTQSALCMCRAASRAVSHRSYDAASGGCETTADRPQLSGRAKRHVASLGFFLC